MATAAAGGNDRLGDTLMRDGLLSREQLKQALVEQKLTKHRLGFVLVKLGLVPELEITKVLARQFRMPAVDLSRFEVDPKILKLVPGDMATKGVVLPLKREGRTLTVAGIAIPAVQAALDFRAIDLGQFGAQLPPTEEGGKPFAIKLGQLRGVESQGMLCSARELKLSDDHGGLLILDDAAPVATSYPIFFDTLEKLGAFA